MEKQITDLIRKLEKNKQHIEYLIIEQPENEEKNCLLLHSGKIIAFDYCITELKKIVQSKPV